MWDPLLEHAQLLYGTGRPLDELAAIFTPALFTSPSEKACLQLIALFNLDIESSHETSDRSHDVSYGVSDEELLTSHTSLTCSLPGQYIALYSCLLPFVQFLLAVYFINHQPISFPSPGMDAECPSDAQHGGLLDYSALGGGGDISEHSSLLSEGSAVLLLEKELMMASLSPTVTPGARQPLHSTSSDESCIATPPVYVPTALESRYLSACGVHMTQAFILSRESKILFFRLSEITSVLLQSQALTFF